MSWDRHRSRHSHESYCDLFFSKIMISEWLDHPINISSWAINKLLVTLSFYYHISCTYYEMWINFPFSLYRGQNSDGCVKCFGSLEMSFPKWKMGWPICAIGQPKVSTLGRTASSVVLSFAVAKVSKGALSH